MIISGSNYPYTCQGIPLGAKGVVQSQLTQFFTESLAKAIDRCGNIWFAIKIFNPKVQSQYMASEGGNTPETRIYP